MRDSAAICAIAEYVQSATLRQPSHDDAQAELSALSLDPPANSGSPFPA